MSTPTKKYDKEVFEPVKGYEGYYDISNYGRLWSHKKNDFKDPHTQIKGYLEAALYKDTARRRFKIHQLVAKAFVPNPSKLDCVIHKDGDKKNNYYKNLKWCTQAETSELGVQNQTH